VSKPLGIDEQVRHIYAALQHLEHGRSTVEIGEELGISRFMVGRMIRRAREDGLVDIVPRIADPIDVRLSSELGAAFKLTGAYAVIPPTDTLEHTRSTIATVAAKLFPQIVHEDDIVGLSAGRTILEMCSQTAELPTCDVVQLTGVATNDANDMMRAVMTLSSVSRGRMFPLHAPFITTDARAGEMMAAQPAIKQALKRMDRLDRAVLTVGGWPDAAMLADQLRALGELDEVTAHGVVAEIGTTLLDADGNPLHVLEGRMVGVSLEQLQRIPTKLVVAGGHAKQRAVLAALRAGLVDILVTDVETARFALAHA
jgi:DNA-binding transcriptional regulator LsrR (DeoR family)